MSGKTSNESKSRYNRKAYHPVAVTLRIDDDKDIIEFIEKHKEDIGTTQLFRQAMELYMKEINR